jgi:hypothetical protein
MFLSLERRREIDKSQREALELNRRLLDLAENIHKDNKTLLDLCKQLLDENKALIVEIKRLKGGGEK